MTLRTRLLLGYGYLVALLILAVGSSILGFLRLSEGIDQLLEENVRSIRASTRMLEALERQDSTLLAALLAKDAAGEIGQWENLFEEAYIEASNNVTEDAERDVLKRLRDDYDVFRRERDALLAERPERPLAAYDQRVRASFEAVKDEAQSLYQVNYEAMIESDRRARQAAVQNGAWLGFLVTVALITLVLLSRAMQRWILSRLDAITASMESISSGRLLRRLEVGGRDELAVVAERFNELLDRYTELRAQTTSRLALERRMVVALIAHLGPEVSLWSPSGDLLAGDPGVERDAEEELGRALRENGRPRLGGDGEAESKTSMKTSSGEAFRAEVLIAPGGRQVGWLVRRAKKRPKKT